MLARRLRDYLGEHPFWILLVCLLVAGCATMHQPKEVMCTYAGLETIPASSPECVAPPPPPPPPPPPTCQYNPNILAVDPACVAPTQHRLPPPHCRYDPTIEATDAACKPGQGMEVRKGKPGEYSIRVYYATDRDSIKTTANIPYGSGGGKMQYGVVWISFPPTHEEGKLESPGIWERVVLRRGPDVRKHVVLGEVTPLPKEKMFSLLSLAAQHADSEVFVFIHGFNTGFEEAARRTGQLARDLQLKAVPVMYSWPSAAKPTGYVADSGTVERVYPDLEQFLEEILQTDGVAKVHVIAHSMGGQLLSRAIQNLTLPEGKQFQNVVLAAPDINAAVFRETIVPAMRRAAKRVTIYASANDQALRLSQKRHNNKRLGQARDWVSVFPDFDTIDASDLPHDWLGHSYFAGNSRVINDLFDALMHNIDAGHRHLDPVDVGNAKYYRFRK